MKDELEVKEPEDKKENELQPSQFSDVNGVRRAISLSNIWKV